MGNLCGPCRPHHHRITETMRHSCFLNLWVLGLLFAAGFGLPRAQAIVASAQVIDSLPPLVDRLPAWYFEQKPNQAVGVSFAGIKEEAAFHQAVLTARIRAALQQLDPEVVKGEIQSASSREKKTGSNQEDRSYRCEASAKLKLPVDYTVLDQCRLKNGTVMVLLEYGHYAYGRMEDLNCAFLNEIKNDMVEWYMKMTLPDKYVLEMVRTDSSFLMEELYGNVFLCQHLLYDCKNYCNLSHNPNLLMNPDEKTEKYLGWLNIEGLLTDLCRKLIFRDLKSYNK